MKGLNFKDIAAKWKAMPVKTKNIIFIVLGIFILVAAYYLGFSNLQTSTDAINEELETQTAYCEELKGYYDSLDTYEAGIEADKKEINADLATLPLGLNSEDMLMYVKTMNETIGSNLQHISFDADEFIGEFGCVVGGKSVNASAMRAGASYTATLNYSQFKDTLQYIYDKTNEVTFIDTVSVTYNSADVDLDLDLTLSKYYITYDGCEYVPVAVPDVSLGNTNPFGTE